MLNAVSVVFQLIYRRQVFPVLSSSARPRGRQSVLTGCLHNYIRVQINCQYRSLYIQGLTSPSYRHLIWQLNSTFWPTLGGKFNPFRHSNFLFMPGKASPNKL